MKNLKKIIGVFLIMLILTGCTMKAEYAIVINSNKSLTISTQMILDDELVEGLMSMQEGSTEESVEYTEEEKWAFVDTMFEDTEIEDKDVVLEKYDKDGYKGYTMKKEFANIDEVTGDDASFDLNEDSLSEAVVFSKNGDNYKANITFEPTEDMNSGASYGVDFEMVFTVTLPNKPISHNATTVSEDGKTLTWDLMNEDFDGTINFEFNFNADNTMLFIIIGAAVLLVAVVIVVIVMVNKNKKNKGSVEPVETSTPMINNNPAPQAPMQTQMPMQSQEFIQPQAPMQAEVPTPSQEIIQPQAPTQQQMPEVKQSIGQLMENDNNQN